jgi:signal transduction histidine kinase
LKVDLASGLGNTWSVEMPRDGRATRLRAACEKADIMSPSNDQNPQEQLTAEEAQFRRWLVDFERRAILPLKWALLVSSIVVWEYTRLGVAWPEVDVFMVFFVYALSILALHYFLVFSAVPLRQVRVFCYASYAIDLLYVTALVYLDHRHPRAPGLGMPDFYILYFLLLIRGLALHRTAIDSVVVTVLISLLFIFSFWLEERSPESVVSRTFLVKMSLVWMVIFLAWFIFDIINRQKFELLRARERLYQSERLTALGELAAGVAHEINNPIGIISTYADYLLRQAEQTDPHREDYEVIHSEAQRCKRIVGELLSFARPTETRREPTDLCALNDEVLRFIFHDPSNTQVQLAKSYGDDLPWVHIDPVHIKQALLNVYVNAQQALGTDGGEIAVDIAAAGRRGLRLTVADTGRGIEPKDMARLFDPFFTSKPGGTGLGLTITRRLLEANDAEIDIQSRSPRGVIVTIVFHTLVSPLPGGAETH